MKQPIERMSAEMKKQEILSSIVLAVSDKPLSIAQISREFSLNRSTTRYYLGLLKEDNLIFFDRKEHEPGRPTYINLNINEIEKRKEEISQKFQKYLERMKDDPIVNEVRSFLKVKKRATEEEIMKHIRDKKIDDIYISKTISALVFLGENEGFSKEWSYTQNE